MSGKMMMLMMKLSRGEAFLNFNSSSTCPKKIIFGRKSHSSEMFQICRKVLNVSYRFNCHQHWNSQNLTVAHFHSSSPEWTLRMCFVKSLFVMLEKSHCGHLWGLSPEWVILCCIRENLRLEAKSHWSHWYDFSPEWVILCSFIYSNWIEEYSHWLHWWCLTPACALTCLLRLPGIAVE